MNWPPFRSIGSIPPKIGWSMDRHCHDDFHELIVVLSGAMEVKIGGRCIRARSGEVLFYPRGESHSERALGKRPLVIIFMGFGDDRQGAWRKRPFKAQDPQGRIRMLARWMLELRSQQSQRSEAKGESMRMLLAMLLQEYDVQHLPADRALEHKISAYARRHLSKPLSLEDLAMEADMSKFHFSRTFKRMTGASPMEYVRRMRVEAAKTLLLSTPQPLKAIAPQVGFADEFHLSKVFRQVAGKAPGKIRKEAVRIS